jgi:tyrosine-protein phosphatase SIW14
VPWVGSESSFDQAYSLEAQRGIPVRRIAAHSVYISVMRPKHLSSALFAAILVILLAGGSLEAKPNPAITQTGKSFAKVAPEAGIRRFAEICPGLSRGGEPGEDGLRYLHGRGFRTIVSFLPSSAESAFVVQSGMQYVHIPMHSGIFFADAPTDEQVHQFLSVVTDTTLYPIFIHCHAGKDRTGAMSAIYRMQACGWTKDEAVEEMMAFGFSGRYGKLLRYVQGYTPSPSSPLPPPTAVAGGANQDSPKPTSVSAPAAPLTTP